MAGKLSPAPAARVRSDYTHLNQLAESVRTAKAAHAKLEEEYKALAAQLVAAEAERAALAADFGAKASALADVEVRLQDSCAYGRDLQGQLDAAADKHRKLVDQAAALRTALAEKVGAAGCRAGCAEQAGVSCFTSMAVWSGGLNLQALHSWRWLHTATAGHPKHLHM